MNKLFGGQNGISPVPSVHPVIDDESSTSLASRGKEERSEDTMVKSKGLTKRDDVTSGNNVSNKSVDPAAANAIPAASLDKVAGAMLENGTSAGLGIDVENIKETLGSFSSPLDTINALNETAKNTGSNPAGITGVYSPETGMSYGVGGLSG